MVKTILSGGGINSNKTVQSRSGQKVEPKPHAANVEGVGQIGLQHAFKPKPMLEGPGYTTKPQGDTGIAGARQGPAGAGPGGMGRTIYRSGSQGPTPAASEMAPSRDYFNERPNKGNRP